MPIIEISIDDVVKAGSVEEAIHEWCLTSDEVACGVIGSSFTCLCLGSGLEMNFNVNDHAKRALSDDYGAIEYIDAKNGRAATIDSSGDIVWSANSKVALIVPSEEDALKNRNALRAMAIAVRDYHSVNSDTDGWNNLLQNIQIAAENIKGIKIKD